MKISGEALAGERKFGLNEEMLLGKENLEAQVHIEGAEAVDPDDERNYLGRVTLLVTDPRSEAREGEVEPEVLDRAGGHRVSLQNLYHSKPFGGVLLECAICIGRPFYSNIYR